MDFFESLFAFLSAGIFFYIGFIVFFLALVFMSEEEYWGKSLFILFVGYICFELLTKYNPTRYILSNPLVIFYGFLGYFSVGILWCYIKWTFHVNNRADKFLTLKESFLEEHKLDKSEKIPSNLMIQFIESCRNYLYIENRSIPYAHYDDDRLKVEALKDFNLIEAITPKPRNYKSKISYWIAWWPTSLVWTLFDEPLRKIVDAIYKRIVNVLEDVANRRFNKIDI